MTELIHTFTRQPRTLLATDAGDRFAENGRSPTHRQDWDFNEDAAQQRRGALQIRRRPVRTDPDHQAADRFQIQNRGGR